MGQWLADNFFNIVTTVCGTGLWFTAYSIRQDAEARKEETKARKVANLLAITANHRELWKEYLNNPNLARVRDTAANLAQQPVTPAEESFISQVVSHTSSVFDALKDDLLTRQEGLRRDVQSFFSLPIPNAVWSKTKLLQNQDFAAFIDSSLKN